MNSSRQSEHVAGGIWRTVRIDLSSTLPELPLDESWGKKEATLRFEVGANLMDAPSTMSDSIPTSPALSDSTASPPATELRRCPAPPLSEFSRYPVTASVATACRLGDRRRLRLVVRLGVHRHPRQ
jgi:hypothetical protein